MASACGIHIDQTRFRLVALEGSAKKHRITTQASIGIPAGEDPAAFVTAELKRLVKENKLGSENVALAVDSGLAAFRTLTLPFDDASKIEEVIKRMEDTTKVAEIKKKELVDKHMNVLKEENKQATPCKLSKKIMKNKRSGNVHNRLYELKKNNAQNVSNLKEEILNQLDPDADKTVNYSMMADLGGEGLKETPISNQIIVNKKGKDVNRHQTMSKNQNSATKTLYSNNIPTAKSKKRTIEVKEEPSKDFKPLSMSEKLLYRKFNYEFSNSRDDIVEEGQPLKLEMVKQLL